MNGPEDFWWGFFDSPPEKDDWLDEWEEHSWEERQEMELDEYEEEWE
jgi:hypothetical protein